MFIILLYQTMSQQNELLNGKIKNKTFNEIHIEQNNKIINNLILFHLYKIHYNEPLQLSQHTVMNYDKSLIAVPMNILNIDSYEASLKANNFDKNKLKTYSENGTFKLPVRDFFKNYNIIHKICPINISLKGTPSNVVEFEIDNYNREFKLVHTQNDESIYKDLQGNLLTLYCDKKLYSSNTNKYITIRTNKIYDYYDILERRNIILKEIGKIREIIKIIYDEEIYNKLKNKGKHCDPNNNNFHNTDNKNIDQDCSLTYVHYKIYSNRINYDKSYNLIKKYFTCSSYTIKRKEQDKKKTQERLFAYVNRNFKNPSESYENLCENEFIREFTNKYLLAKIVDTLCCYENYLIESIKFISHDPIYLNEQFGFNNTVNDFIKIIHNTYDKKEYKTTILIKDVYMDMFIRKGDKYYLGDYYRLCLDDKDEWNIHCECLNNNNEISHDTINEFIKDIVTKAQKYNDFIKEYDEMESIKNNKDNIQVNNIRSDKDIKTITTIHKTIDEGNKMIIVKPKQKKV